MYLFDEEWFKGVPTLIDVARCIELEIRSRIVLVYQAVIM